MEHLREAEMNLRKVNEHGDGGAAGADSALKLAELAIDARQVAHDLRKSHDRHVFRADDDLDSGGSHPRPAHSPELRSLTLWRRALPQRAGQQRPVEFAAGFARRNED
jgi:hypothetical protein